MLMWADMASLTALIAVVAHEHRRGMANTLIDAIDPFYVSWDDGSRGCFGNHLNAWKSFRAAPEHDWCVVLEDDAVPVAGFMEQLHQALAVAPSPVVSLYLGRDRPRIAQPAIREVVQYGAYDGPWIMSTSMFHAVGIAMRADVVGAMIEVISQAPAVVLPIDSAISFWAEQNDYRVAYTWPSLVDHADTEPVTVHSDGQPRCWQTMPNGIPRRMRRVAWRTGTRTHWGTSTVELTV